MGARKILIYGVPGAGKTFYSRQLHAELRYPLIEADALRMVAHQDKTKTEDPFVYLGTTEAWQQFGNPTLEHVVQGLVAVRRAMSAYIADEIGKFPGALIMEAAFLDPHELSVIGECVLVVTTNEDRHRMHYLQHRDPSENNIQAFHVARMLQEHLLQEADALGVSVVENNFPGLPF